MRTLLNCACVLIVLGVLASQVSGQAEEPRPDGLPTDLNVIAFGMRAEGALFSELRDATPVSEAYFQRFIPDEKLGYVIDKDYYLLGRFKWGEHLVPVIEDLLTYPVAADDKGSQKSTNDQQILDGIAQTMAPDWKQLGPERYEYKFVGLYFLGALRCVVYDVKPLNPEEGEFTGRVYLEDQSYNIVRFTGMSKRVDAMLAGFRDKNSRFRIDSWRMNVAKNRWVPAYVYVEEVPPLDAPELPVVKGQIRFWGYNKKGIQQQKFTDIVLDESPAAGDKKWHPPHQSQQMLEKQAEENVLDRFLEARFLGAPDEVEKKLDQVLTNLIVPNKLVFVRPVHCRVLLTTPLEAFTVGNTIVLSRGLIDVTPDESAIALVLAHQLAHNILGHRTVDTKLAFSDVLRISDAELLAKLRFHHSLDEETAADKKAMKILEQSLYGAKMSGGGLFMEALQADAKQLSHLIQPHFGEHFADANKAVITDQSLRKVPLCDPELTDQVCALPLGSKLVVDPWDGGVKLFQSELPLNPKPLDPKPFAITSLMPFEEYFTDKVTVLKPATMAAKRSTSRNRQTTNRPKPHTKKHAS